MANTPKKDTAKRKPARKAPSVVPTVSEPSPATNPPPESADTVGTKPTCGPESTFKGKAGRSGAPKDNRNNMRHGLKAGKLPADAQYIEHQMNALRRQLEDAVIATKGEVSLTDAAHVQTAIKWERHGALALRWLRVDGENLKPVERLTFSREIARASAERDKAIAAMDLGDKTAGKPWLLPAPASEDTND